jgi:DNA-nicking Smr family endonuclease
MTGKEKPRSRRRLLSETDRELWFHVTRSVAPLKPRTGRLHAGEAVKKDPVEASAPAKAAKPAAAAPPAVRAPPAPPLAPIDRRSTRRLKRGTDSIDARIDLHGMTQEEAHDALVSFMRRAQASGAKFVLVITGKGARAASAERGVLRRQVPFWLTRSDLRPLVLGYEPASARHGGEGALYVRLRRRRASAPAE